MPATAVTNWTTVLSGLAEVLARTACAVASPSGETPFLCGVRSCMLKYSEDVSRRRGVACFVRAMVFASVRRDAR